MNKKFIHELINKKFFYSCKLRDQALLLIVEVMVICLTMLRMMYLHPWRPLQHQPPHYIGNIQSNC